MIHGKFARLGLLLLSTQLSVVAATHTVNITTDDITATACSASVSGDCSLRGALTIVASGDTIDFDLPAASVITLVDDLPSIDDKNLTIDGSTVSGVTISGKYGGYNTYHPFHISSDSNVTIQGLSIVSGRGDSEGGAIHNEGNLTIIESTLSGNYDVEGKGGAIYNSSGATLKVIDSNITSNVSTEYYSNAPGGAIYSEGNVTISGSKIMNNISISLGGAIFIKSATLKVNNSTISANKSYGYGGAVSTESSTIEVSHSTISDNNSSVSGGAVSMESSTLEMSYSTISGNDSKNSGGAIHMKTSTLELSNTTISDNTSFYSGGAINLLDSNLSINSSIISDNNAIRAGGGGISASNSDFKITDSTLSNNVSDSAGGAIGADRTSLRIINSTISGNTAYKDGGGGIFSSWNNHLYISHSTIVDNRVLNAKNKFLGGGISLYYSDTTIIKNSIISGNSTQHGKNDCYNYHGYSALTSEGYNLIEAPDSTCSFGTNDVIGVAPDLGSLADNGGSTKTHAVIPIAGNPVLNTGTCLDISGTTLPFDQRGEARPGGIECDIGAFEFGTDTDGDGLDDLTETAYGTNPTLEDSDIDGLNDGDEVHKYKTDPTKFDTDGDGAGDGDEIAAGTNPLDQNSYPIVSISPIEFLFGSTSGTTDFSITNTTTNDVTLPSAALQGPDGGSAPSGFSIANDACAGTLPAGQSCTIQVVYPTSSNESRSAFLQIGGVKLTAFLHNYEGLREEAVRRLPAVIGSIDYDPEMAPGYVQTIDWSFVGYDDHNYTSHIAFFNCTSVAAGECAQSYGSSQRFAQGLHLQPNNVTTTPWSYKGLEMKQYDYSFDFTPEYEMPLVMRFYYQSGLDTDLGLRSISTIIPGGFLFDGEPYDYYDTSGRKISAEVTYNW